MTHAEQIAFYVGYWPGLALLALTYMLVTAYRGFREFFMAELWDDLLGPGNRDPAVFTATEVPVAVLSLGGLALMFLLRSNRGALLVMLGALVAAAALFIGGGTLLFQRAGLPPVAWMISVGAGVFMLFNALNVFLLERLVAATGRPHSIAFLVFAFDGLGKIGTTVLLFYKNFGQPDLEYQVFFEALSWVTAAAATAMLTAAAAYFAWRLRRPAARRRSGDARGGYDMPAADLRP